MDKAQARRSARDWAIYLGIGIPGALVVGFLFWALLNFVFPGLS